MPLGFGLSLNPRRSGASGPVWLSLVQQAEAAAAAAGASLWYVPPASYADRAINGPFVNNDGSGGNPAVGSGVTGWLASRGVAGAQQPNWQGFASWSLQLLTRTANAGLAPDGSNTAWALTPTAGATDAAFSHPVVAMGTAPLTWPIWLRSTTGGSFDIAMRLIRDSPFATAASRTITVTPEWQLFYFTATPLDSSSHRWRLGAGSVWTFGENLLAWEQPARVSTEATQSTSANRPVFVPAPGADAAFLGPELSAYAAGFASTAGISGVGATVSVASGVLTATATSSDGADRAEIPISGLTVGRTYRVEIVSARGAQGSQQTIRASTALDIPNTGITTTAQTTYRFTVSATAASGVIRVYAQDAAGAVGDSVLVSSISVREVPTGAEAGFGALSFDGSNDRLSTASFGSVNTETLIAAFARTSASGPYNWRAACKLSGVITCAIGQASDGGLTARVDTVSGARSQFLASSLNTPIVSTLQVGTSGYAWTVNGAAQSVASLNATYVPAAGTLDIGANSAGSEFAPANVSLVCYAPAALTTAQREAIERLGAYIVGAPYPGL